MYMEVTSIHLPEAFRPSIITDVQLNVAELLT